MSKVKNNDIEDELQNWFIKYFKYLESTDSKFFCENLGILEHCARDRIEYQWEDRVFDNLGIVKSRYPELYKTILKHLLNWIEKIQEAKDKEVEKGNVILLKKYR